MSKWIGRIGWLVIIVLFAWFHAVYAIDDGAPTGRTRAFAVFPAEDYITILDSSPATSTGYSTIKDFQQTPKIVLCTVKVAAGTVPTSWTFEAATGPADSSANMVLAYPTGTSSTTISTFPAKVSFLEGYTDRYWRIRNLSSVGSDATTRYSVTCTGLK